jgi:glycerol-3-phosphate acyltransferase PlsY
LLALDLNIGLSVIGIWALTFAIFRTSSISSIAAIFSSIILSICYGTSISQILFCIFLFALILYRHKENLERLIAGKEKKF